MVNAQQYLDNNYSKDIKILEINNQNLEGSLIIQDFPNLEKINCRDNKGITSIKLINLPNLDYFHGNGCHLENVTIDNCSNITFFNVANNYLTDTNFLDSLNSEKLVELSLHTNNFPEQDLSVFSKFSNLEQLFLDNCDEDRFKKGEYNQFTGSLKPLKDLSKLELLSIGNTNIDSGLEFLPESFRKIGLNTSWWEQDTRCSKLRQELERTVQIKEVNEKLKSEREENSKGEQDPAWFSDYYRLAPWRQAQKFGKKTAGTEANEWLEKNYPSEKREKVTFANINGKNLVGELKMTGFINLQKLDCSFNQLTNLDLSNCQNLTHLNCSWNDFINLEFLEKIPNPKELRVLRVNNNSKIKDSLEWVRRFEGLTSLNLESCSFFGSLEPIRGLDKLERLFIGRTHINEGLEHLPISCRELYCDYDPKYKSTKLAEELSKFSENEYYNIDQWRAYKADNTTASVIPLERLFVIRSNLKKYVDKWGVKEEENNIQTTKEKIKSHATTCLTWPYQKINKWLTKEEGLSELSKLENPSDANWQWWANASVQWTNRAALVVGGSLVLVGQSDTADSNSQAYTQAGGIISIAGPFVETLTSYINDQILAVRQAQWDDFMADTKNMLDNYHELLGILEQIEKKNLGEVNKMLNDLRKVTKTFLDEYDKEDKENNIRKNGVIDISELTEDKARAKFAKDLDKEDKWSGASQLGRIVKMMKKLEEEIVDYRQENKQNGSVEELDNQKQNLAWIIIDVLKDYNIEEEYNQKGSENNNWNGKDTWKDYLTNEITNETNKKDLEEKKSKLLLPLLEILVEQLGKTDITILLTDKVHEQKIAEFLKKTEDFYEACQELESAMLKEVLASLKKQVEELKKIEKVSANARDNVTIDMEKTANEEKKALEEIIEKISNLDENLKNLHAKLTNDKSKEKDESQAYIEQIPYGVAGSSGN